jgi:hypothetical protein
MSPQTHTALSPLPLARNATAVIGKEEGSSQCPRRSSRDTYRGVAPEHRQWSRSRQKFWIYESPPSNSSQDGRSNTSSGGNSTRSEGPEERLVRTVSPYGSFFAEEMEFDPPGESRSFYRGDRWENATASTDMTGTFYPTPKPPSSWRSSQAQMTPALFAKGYPTTYARPPGAVIAPDHKAAGAVRVPFSPSFLAENSRQSQPPISWRDSRETYVNGPHSPRWHTSQCDPPQVAEALPSGRSLSGRDERQTRGKVHGRRRR